MIRLADLAARPAPWLAGPAPEGDIVLSSRVRLARNLEGETFAHRVPDDRLGGIRERVVEAAAEVPQLTGSAVWTMDALSELERGFLLERHLISVDLVRNVPGRALLVTDDESEGIMVNEEDHLRLQTFSAGLSPRHALDRALALAGELDRRIPFSYDERLGYLTACPTNVGTGLRASLLLHLPGLALTGDIDKVLNSLRRLNYTVRGFYGEGSGVMGHLYQVSNSVTLGRTEETIVEDLLRHAGKAIACERQAREALLERDRARVEDRVWRAWGLLTHARMLTTQEAFELLGDVRLGTSLELLPEVDESHRNMLLMSVQGAHLQLMAQRPLEPAERDAARAQLVREQLSKP